MPLCSGSGESNTIKLLNLTLHHLLLPRICSHADTAINSNHIAKAFTVKADIQPIIMIEESSGIFFRFKLDFDLGFGFAEVYDFRDVRPVDGIMVFVYHRIDKEIANRYSLEAVISSGIALGPIRLYSYPNSRGKGAWKRLGKRETLVIRNLMLQRKLRI